MDSGFYRLQGYNQQTNQLECKIVHITYSFCMKLFGTLYDVDSSHKFNCSISCLTRGVHQPNCSKNLNFNTYSQFLYLFWYSMHTMECHVAIKNRFPRDYLIPWRKWVKQFE